MTIDNSAGGHSGQHSAGPAKPKRTKWFFLTAAILLLLILLIVVLVKFLPGTADADSAAGSTAGTEAQGATAVTDVSDRAAKVITTIENRPGFLSGEFWDPVALIEDFNGDDIPELLAVYEMNAGAAPKVMYELWTLGPETPKKLKSEDLFFEVGGNSGIVGIVTSSETTYLAIARYEPEGDVFHDFYVYIPWDDDTGTISTDSIAMETHGTIDEPESETYFLNDTAIEKEQFEELQNDFSDWTYTLDLLDDTGNPDTMTFDEIRRAAQ